MQTQTLNIKEIEALALQALLAAGTSLENAKGLAYATAMTEADGIASHGLAYIPIYCEHVQCGKVDGNAKPSMEIKSPVMIAVDAACGFAHPAIDLGFPLLFERAKAQGIAILLVKNSYNCGVLGYHSHRIAKAGLVGLGFTNAPASIAPAGGAKPVLGTNPFSLAVPDMQGEAAILIDQSASIIAKSEIMKHAREEKEIPLGWALDEAGQPTSDPNIALKGSMAPLGWPSASHKGVGMALLTEMMAAVLTGACLGMHASPFSGTKGGPPKTGQCFIAINPAMTSDENSFLQHITDLTQAIQSQVGAHMPGDGRKKKREQAAIEGVAVNQATLDKIQAIIDNH